MSKTAKCRVVKEYCRKSKSPGKRPCKKGKSSGTIVKTHTSPKGCADDKVEKIQAVARGRRARTRKTKKVASTKRIQSAARGKAARTGKAKKLSSVKKLQGVARRMSKSKLRVAPTPPKSATVKLSDSDMKLLTTYNRKDEYGKMMTPPLGTAKIVKKVIPHILEAYDDHLLSERGRKQLVFLRISSTSTQKLSMENSFPDKSDFTRLLTHISQQYESAGSNQAHWIIYTLTNQPTRELKRQQVVDSPLWEKFQDEMGDPTHWFQYLMTLVLIHRYEYAKKVFFSSFTDADVEELIQRYQHDLKKVEADLKWWESQISKSGEASGDKKELANLHKEMKDLMFNIDNSKRITQKQQKLL